MSLQLRDRVTATEYQWEDETGFKVSRNCWAVFVGLVHQRKLATGAFVGAAWDKDLEDEVCRKQGLDCIDKAVPEPRERTWADFEQFLHVMGRWNDAGKGFVPQEEAERRAEICVACPNNRAMGNCSGCKFEQVAAWVGRLIARRSTQQDKNLLQCSTCGCHNTVAVHFPLEAQRDDRFKASDFAQGCWKKEAYS